MPIIVGVLQNSFRPNLQWINGPRATTNAGWSNYHAVQLQIQRRFYQGLQFQGNFTWGKNLDVTSSSSGSTGVHSFTFRTIHDATISKIKAKTIKSPGSSELRIDITLTVSLYETGRKFYDKGDSRKALWYLEAVKNDPTFALISRMSMGTILWNEDNHAEAVKSFRELIQLDNLVTIDEQANPPQRFRFNRYIAATVSAGLTGGYTIADGIRTMNTIARRALDESYTTSLAGAARDFAESTSSLIFVFVLALVLTFLILAAQFESFRDPFIIMFTVPLAVAGALISLWYFTQTVNIFSQIGMIMLIGLVTKNGILIVEFANKLQLQGHAKLDAVREAAMTRLRPILMTTAATIAGHFPLTLVSGAGAAARNSIGLVLVGGLFVGTIFTLFVVPSIYMLVARDHGRDREREAAGTATGSA